VPDRRQRPTGRRAGGRLLLRADRAEGHNNMRVFQEEIFGPVLAVTTFTDEAEAVRDRQRHPLRPRRRRVDPRRQPRLPDGPGHQGRAGVDQLLPPLPAGAAFGGYKISGVGRENHR
jgi:aldehyde dehydrogenase